MSFSVLIELLTDSLSDCARLFPFLIAVYLLMEYLEHRAGSKNQVLIGKAGRFGPLLGGLLGIVPQCGFSAAAAGLYAGGILTAGTLIAVFLSTSDEMLPIMLSKGMNGNLILKILALKFLCAAVGGFFVDLCPFFIRPGHEISELCEEEECHCDEKGIFQSALYHSLKITLFLFVITFLAGIAITLVGEESIASLSENSFLIGQMLAGLIGLIPNCAVSVLLTGLYVDGIISGGIMFAGLLVSAGVGVLTLLRLNHDKKDNAKLLIALYVSGVFFGLMVDLCHIL